jgi:hypothetical protein
MICFIYLGGSVKRERLGAWGMYLACNRFVRFWGSFFWTEEHFSIVIFGVRK